MSYRDVVDVLLEEHDEIRRLCAAVERARGDEKAQRFDDLVEAFRRHERGEQSVVHPAARDSTAAGNLIGLARVTEEDSIERSFEGLQVLGAGDSGFDRAFTRVYRAVLDHLTREELDEFPLLRLYVPVQRLHMMAGELHDVQVMDAV